MTAWPFSLFLVNFLVGLNFLLVVIELNPQPCMCWDVILLIYIPSLVQFLRKAMFSKLGPQTSAIGKVIHCGWTLECTHSREQTYPFLIFKLPWDEHSCSTIILAVMLCFSTSQEMLMNLDQDVKYKLDRFSWVSSKGWISEQQTGG